MGPQVVPDWNTRMSYLLVAPSSTPRRGARYKTRVVRCEEEQHGRDRCSSAVQRPLQERRPRRGIVRLHVAPEGQLDQIDDAAVRLATVGLDRMVETHGACLVTARLHAAMRAQGMRGTARVADGLGGLRAPGTWTEPEPPSRVRQCDAPHILVKRLGPFVIIPTTDRLCACSGQPAQATSGRGSGRRVGWLRQALYVADASTAGRDSGRVHVALIASGPTELSQDPAAVTASGSLARMSRRSWKRGFSVARAT